MAYGIVCKKGLVLLEGKEAVGRLEFQQFGPAHPRQQHPSPAGGAGRGIRTPTGNKSH